MKNSTKTFILIAGSAIGGYLLGFYMSHKKQKITTAQDERHDEELYTNALAAMERYSGHCEKRLVENADKAAFDDSKLAFNTNKPELREYTQRLMGIYYGSDKTDTMTNTDHRMTPVGIYGSDKTDTTTNIVDETASAIDPYIIPSEDFAKLDDYDDVTLTYYSDDVLADETDHRMTPAEIISAIGRDTLDQLGDEDDAIYVRNPRLKIDYEICCDMRTYEEVLNEKPYIRDEERYREELEDE